MWPFTSAPAAEPTSAPDQQPPAVMTPADSAASADKCPVDHSTRRAWLDANSGGGGAEPSTPHPFHPSASSSTGASGSGSGSGSGLSQHRVISSIPRGATSPSGPSQPPPSEHAQPEASTSTSSSTYSTPAPAPAPAPAPVTGGAVKDSAGNWVYPSEQQFFNAMMRKNHNPRPADMRTIVPIHNAVNEKAWEQILVWESKIDGSEKCGGPRLVSFVGKPRERTPKAWLKTAFGYTPPFDRHDWLVDRCGTQVRYVIDFYTGRAGSGDDAGKMSFYLDVRPAVDNWEGVKTRMAGWWS
ncbi:cytochrome c heme-lyase [Kwoniella heveanensis BCC8398]|uniref:Holocytochrome c-type synthase n=1 Tax=Kwoniella heveanensis BCC8398 TaxID=1296120 RepID=A0A1B9H143_9TREE|nr:cytochrome c heme-lyase [Kwoniella heveanensis BCC8398]